MRALQRQDLPVILGIVVWTTITILLLNLIVDLLYTWLDPRVGTGTARDGPTRVSAPGPATPPAASSPAIQPIR